MGEHTTAYGSASFLWLIFKKFSQELSYCGYGSAFYKSCARCALHIGIEPIGDDSSIRKIISDELVGCFSTYNIRDHQ